MSKDSGRFLPLMAEALKDIYSRMDEIMEKLNKIEENLKDFFQSIGQKNMIVIQNLKKLQGVVGDFKKEDHLKKSIQTLSETLTGVQEGIWFLEFQQVLKRFQAKLDEY
ncbi:MAG: hypothetical protein ACTSQI_06365 [Candidatus Helarchaeota archaeon]